MKLQFTMHLLLLVICLLPLQEISSVSLVYSLKIRRSFAPQQYLNRDNETLWLLSAVPVVYWRKRHITAKPLPTADIHEKTFLGGSVFNLRCITPHNWWAELTAAAARETRKFCGTQNQKFSHTGGDDITLTVGKDWLFNHKSQCTFYGIAGFPTRTKVTLQDTLDPLVGTRFFGLGFGAEGSYSFVQNEARAVSAILQTRFVHFFDRKWFPILPCSAKIEPGNITDIFAILRYREKENIVEIGTNPTFFTQQAALLETGKVDAPNFTRQSFYANYMRLFTKSLLWGMPGCVGIGFNISTAKLFKTKIADIFFNISLLF